MRPHSLSESYSIAGRIRALSEVEFQCCGNVDIALGHANVPRSIVLELFLVRGKPDFDDEGRVVKELRFVPHSLMNTVYGTLDAVIEANILGFLDFANVDQRESVVKPGRVKLTVLDQPTKYRPGNEIPAVGPLYNKPLGVQIDSVEDIQVSRKLSGRANITSVCRTLVRPGGVAPPGR